MIDFNKMKLGQKIELPHGNWDNLRYIYEACQEFCRDQKNRKRKMFSFTLKYPANRSINPPTKEIYEIERIR